MLSRGISMIRELLEAFWPPCIALPTPDKNIWAFVGRPHVSNSFRHCRIPKILGPCPHWNDQPFPPCSQRYEIFIIVVILPCCSFTLGSPRCCVKIHIWVLLERDHKELEPGRMFAKWEYSFDHFIVLLTWRQHTHREWRECKWCREQRK